jgi:hypothetical protein
MMKNLQMVITKSVLLFLAVLFLCAADLSAQTPQYYNYQNVGTSNNNFPFGMAAGKAVNWLFLAGDFNQPTPLPVGKSISKVYFYVSSGGTSTYTDLRVLFAQTTITDLTSGTFYPGPYDTVYYHASTPLTATTGSWMSITLDHPYPYDPTKSLIMFVGQCGASGTSIGVRNNTLSGGRRVWSVGGCPFTPYASVDAAITNVGFDVINSAPVFTMPDLIYYKFENNPSPTLTPNFAVPGVGTNPAPLTTLTMTSGGQFDSCLSGTATTSAKIVTGYNLSTGTSSFTISMWLNNLPTPASTRYLFGDPGLSFRCFVGGVAPTGGAILRGTGVTDVPINGIFPGPNVIHIVYDSASSSVKVYKNGVFANSVSQTPFNFTAGTGFTVGGYSSSAGLEGLMDEFRFYKRALDSAEIANTWNQDLGLITGVTPVSTQIPKEYKLSQNYPNPFNPVTKINYALPNSGFVTLKVYDMLGREVVKLISENKVAGNYSVDFNASNLTSGVYFYRLEVNGFIDTKKMLLIK